ncbi:MAG TPA: hypothetical protein VHW24_14810 [Bryobacteraceae bacterium]|jgi:hypothetical protein|nr:hypothetical protein [Bryobacteraceae bacterium]
MRIAPKGLDMPYPALFGISVAMSFLFWGSVARYYIWPALKDLPPAEALRPILLFHGFRFIGLAFLLPGVVSADLSAAFARPAAYGDLATAILALLAVAALGSRLGTALAWTVNVIGTMDLLFAFYQGNNTSLADAPGRLGAAFFLVTVVVPLLLIAHGLAFRILLRTESVAPAFAKPSAA